MSSFLFAAKKLLILEGSLVLSGQTIYVIPVTALYSPNATAATPTVADIPSDALPVALGSCQTIASLSFASNGDGSVGLLGNSVTFTAVGAGDDIVAYVLALGNSGGSALLAYIDDMTNLPLTPDGRDINVTFAANGVARQVVQF